MAKLETFQELEVKWAEFNELDPQGMVACSSGTAALHLAFEALQLPLGSQVVMPDLTMVACPRAVVLAGLVPRFVDCNDSLLMEYESQGVRTVEPYSAGLFVHTYGRREDMDGMSSTVGVCHPIVEDLAEAHGIKPHNTSDAACWSFYKNKIVAGEEGGAVYFRDLEHAKLARQLRSLGFTDDHDFTHTPRGHNYRLSNIHAELVLKSLAKADENMEKRRQVEQWYDDLIIPECQMPKRDVVWVYDLRVPCMRSARQNRIVRNLRENGVEARHCFKPMTTLDEWRGTQPVSPNALRLSQEVIYLPVYPDMTEADVTEVVSKFSDALSLSMK